MSTSLRQITTSEAREKVVCSLTLPMGVTDQEIQFELLRAMTWALTGGVASVHILRLLNHSVEVMSGFESKNLKVEEVRENLRKCLDKLSQVGDVVELDGGYWLPAPNRYVNIPINNQSLLVGGLPARLLPIRIKEQLDYNGPFRFVSRSAVQILPIPTEDISDWARKPEMPLGEWAQRILNIDLPDFTESDDSVPFQLYLPVHAKNGAPQFRRWSDRYHDMTGRFLARRYRVYGAREYRVVEVENGVITQSGAILRSREARRLMYAFDDIQENHTQANWLSQNSETQVVLTSDLPEPEHRILGALGKLVLNSQRVYERRWIFADHTDGVAEILQSLSIQINTTKEQYK